MSARHLFIYAHKRKKALTRWLFVGKNDKPVCPYLYLYAALPFCSACALSSKLRLLACAAASTELTSSTVCSKQAYIPMLDAAGHNVQNTPM
jgi:hypothetical protein